MLFSGQLEQRHLRGEEPCENPKRPEHQSDRWQQIRSIPPGTRRLCELHLTRQLEPLQAGEQPNRNTDQRSANTEPGREKRQESRYVSIEGQRAVRSKCGKHSYRQARWPRHSKLLGDAEHNGYLRQRSRVSSRIACAV